MKTIGYHGGYIVYIFAKNLRLTVLQVLVDQVLGWFSAADQVSLLSDDGKLSEHCCFELSNVDVSHNVAT